MQRTAWLAYGLAALLSLPGIAGAQSGDDELARVHFQAGRSYYDRGEYERSIEEFERAYELSRRAELFYNLSLSYQQLGDLDNAIRYLERYLVEVAEVPERANKEVRLANLRERRQAEAREAAASDETSESASSQVPAPAPAQGEVSPPAGYQAAREEVTEASEGTESGGGIPTAAVASFVVAGVGLAAMTAFGLLALNEQSSVEDGCGRFQQCTRDEVAGMDRLALLSDAGLLLAVVGSGIGIAMLFLKDGDSTADLNLELTPWFAQDAGGFAFRSSL